MLDRLGVGLRPGRRGPGTARERPAAGILHAERHGAAPAPPAGAGPAPLGRHEQRAQPAEAVRGHEAERDQLGQRLFDLGAQQAGALDQLVEERRAVLPNAVGDRLRPGARTDRVRRRGERRPVPGMTPRQQGDRRGAHRRRVALAAVRSAVARPEPRPGDPSGQALIVEPARLVVGEARRQDLGLPGAGRRLEAFELRDDDLDRVRPLHARIGRDALPAEEEAQEVARGDRLDLGAQALDRVAVDPGEQPALAPFVRGRCRREAPAHGEAFGLERRERGRDLRRARARAAPPARSRVTGPRPSSRPRRISTSASSRDQSRPAWAAGAAIAGSSLASGQSAWNCGRRSAAIQSVAARRMQPRHAPLARQRREPVAPARLRLRFVRAQEAEPDQRIVQLVGVRGIGPGFGAHPRDRLGIEPAEVGGVLRREPAPAHHRLGPALLQRRVVEIGVGPGRQHLEGQRRRLGQIARDDADGAGLEPRQQPLQTFDVHRVVQAVGDGLADQRMVGDLALADQVLGAGELVGEDRRDQVLGVHARELRRHLPAAAEARQRQRHARRPSASG